MDEQDLKNLLKEGRKAAVASASQPAQSSANNSSSVKGKRMSSLKAAFDMQQIQQAYQDRINAPTDDSHLFLCHAILRHDLDDVKDAFVRFKDIDLNKLHESGQTPMMLAVFEGRLDMVKEILKQKPDLTVEDDLGMSVMDMVQLSALVGYQHPKTSHQDKEEIKNTVLNHYVQFLEDENAKSAAIQARQKNKRDLRSRTGQAQIRLKRRGPKNS